MNDKLVNELNDPNFWDQLCYPDIQIQLMYHIILPFATVPSHWLRMRRPPGTSNYPVPLAAHFSLYYFLASYRVSGL